MFAFGHNTDDGFVLLQDKGHVYTFPSERLAREYLDGVKHLSGLYQVEDDLSVARLVQMGDRMTPPKVTLTEAQKLSLWQSYVYKSLLAWCPYPETIR